MSMLFMFYFLTYLLYLVLLLFLVICFFFVNIFFLFFFFFSSRRRHTRWNCDWSSDVCSSDLGPSRLLAAAVSAVTIAGTVAVAGLSGTAAAADPLISQGKPATASSTENAGTPASAAVDGNTGTRWSSAFSDPQWIQVDLGATANVTQVVLNWEAAFARSFQIQTAPAATGPFTTIFSTSTGAGGIQTIPVAGSGRFVRMNGTVRATQFGYSLWEFQVFGTFAATTCGTTNAALNHPASASSTENAGTPASAAFDGSTTTRWSSAFSDPQWLQVDLGGTATVCQVRLTWEAAFATAFQLQTAPAATGPFSTIFSTTTGTGGTRRSTSA